MPKTSILNQKRKPIRLFVVDDHALFREGLLRLLANDPELEIIGATGDATEAVGRVLEAAPDVLILDHDLGNTTATHVVRDLNQSNFSGRILLVTAGLPDHDALELIRGGIAGIFHKQHPPESLHRNIREVAEGRMLIEPEYLRSIVAPPADGGSAQPNLTERDRQILRFLLEGLSNKEIASQLYLSESAVKASLQALFAKTGVRTRSQLVRIALEKYMDHLQ